MPVRPWRVLSIEQLLDCRVFTVERLKSSSPLDASVHDFFRIRSVDWAQIVPVTDADEIVMVRQYRHGSGELSLEIPAGLIDAGEAPAAAAARECLEETGYAVSGLRSLGVLRPNPALFVNRLHTFAAFGAQPAAKIMQTDTEQTEVELVPVADVADLLIRGIVDHALDTAVLWRFLHEYR
jgi:8-oxo-dGTP pyrophosphatase MutT (NUDIX family)